MKKIIFKLFLTLILFLLLFSGITTFAQSSGSENNNEDDSISKSISRKNKHIHHGTKNIKRKIHKADTQKRNIQEDKTISRSDKIVKHRRHKKRRIYDTWQMPAPYLVESPKIIMSYNIYLMDDFHSYHQPVHGLQFSYFPLNKIIPLFRLGVYGASDFRIGEEHNDWLMRFGGIAGIQFPTKRVNTFIQLSLGGGFVYQERYMQRIVNGLFSLSFMAGVDLAIYYTLKSEFGIGYIYNRFNDLDFHSFVFQVGLGW